MLVAGASVPEAAVMAEVGADADDGEGEEETAEVAEEVGSVAAGAAELAGAACWLALELVEAPPPRSSEAIDCACAGPVASSAATENAAKAARWLFMTRREASCGRDGALSAGDGMRCRKESRAPDGLSIEVEAESECRSRSKPVQCL